MQSHSSPAVVLLAETAAIGITKRQGNKDLTARGHTDHERASKWWDIHRFAIQESRNKTARKHGQRRNL
jgi:hypothetical protein